MAEAKKTTKKAAKEAELTVETVKEDQVPEVKLDIEPDTDQKAVAKAGKRSAKAAKETEAKVAKESRKAETGADKPKLAAKAPRTKLERAGKKYREAAKLIEHGKLYSLNEALELAAKTSSTKFDS